MIKVGFSSEFLRAYNRLPSLLQQEIEEKVTLFKDRSNHARLRVHKLQGRYAECWSFSVNYRFRIVFVYVGKGKNTVSLIAVGDHSIYD